MFMPRVVTVALVVVCFGQVPILVAAEPAPVEILRLSGAAADPAAIDFESLPRIEGTHAVVRRAGSPNVDGKFDLHHLPFQLHSYLLRHDGKFWCLWSEGPPVEDEPTQEVRYATSEDGLRWSESRSVTGRPEALYAFIARGLWVRDGELLALAAHFKGKGAFGSDKELELRAYGWDAAAGEWRLKGMVYKDAINNFPPQRLASGDWITTRRDSRFNVFMLIGGRGGIAGWESFPVVERGEVTGFSPDEPIIWQQEDRSLIALFRDNGGSQRLFYAESRDEGRTWTRPQRSNMPNASSKLFSLETSRGFRVLINNANPKAGRRELHLSTSRDGRTFTQLARLDIPSPAPVEGLEPIWKKFSRGLASLQYPHAIEEDGALWITFSRNKKQIEVLRVSLDSVAKLAGSP